MNFGTLEELQFESVMQNSLDESGRLDWNSVFDYIKGREDSPKNYHQPEEIEGMREVLLDALLTRDCDDESIVLRLLEFCARYLDVVCWRSSAPFGNVPRFDSSRGTVWRRISVPASTTHWVLTPLAHPRHVFSRTGCPFVPRTPGVADAEWTAMNAGDWKFLGALVRYGCWKGLLDSKGQIDKWDFYEFWMYIEKHIRELQGLPFSEKILKGHEVWNRLPENPRGHRRTRLVVRTLKAVALFSEGHPWAEPYTKCLEVYFAALSDPLVSADEVLEFLLRLLGEEDCQHVADRMVDKWVELFGRQTYAPRSLKHLARIRVRSALAENVSGVLPGLVELLPIPPALKDFVLGALE